MGLLHDAWAEFCIAATVVCILAGIGCGLLREFEFAKVLVGSAVAFGLLRIAWKE